MSIDGLETFWGMQGHHGEPNTWNDTELRHWHQKYTGRSASALKQLDKATLVQQAAAELDRLYASFKPSFHFKYRPIPATSLMLWVSGVGGDSRPIGRPVPFGRIAGGIEREFNSMFSLSERMSNVGQQLPMGRTPLDDLRQDLLLAAQVVDRGNSSILFQTYTKDRAMAVDIRKAVLLLPQRSFKAGDRVILLRTNEGTANTSSCSWNNKGQNQGPSPPVTPGSIGTVQDDGAGNKRKPADSAANVSVLFESRPDPVQVPIGKLLMIEQRKPEEGDYVVLHSLQKRPDLAGCMGRLHRLASARSGPGSRTSDGSGSGGSSSSSDTPDASSGLLDERCEVYLAPWLAASTNAQKQHQQTLAPRLSCTAVVEQPQPALLVAFAAHSTSTAAENAAAARFAASEMKHMLPQQSVRTTLREQSMLMQYMEQCKAVLGPCSDALAKKVLGPLSRKHWTLGLMIPVKQPLSDAEQHHKQLKKELVCRCCGRQGSKGQTLQCCQACGAARYCSRQCQVTDWKARHKNECVQRAAATAQGVSQAGNTSHGNSSSSSSSPAAASAGLTSDRAKAGSVLIPLQQAFRPPGVTQDNMVYMFDDGRLFDPEKLAKNVHGDKVFIVKLQNAAAGGTIAAMLRTADNGVQSKDRVMLYDQPRSFMTHVAVGQAGHVELLDVLRSAGRPGRKCPFTRVAYMKAQRVGPNLRLFLHDLPDQEQPW